MTLRSRRALAALVPALLASSLAASAPPASAATSVPQWLGYHGGGTHAGDASGTPAPSTLRVAWRGALDAPVQASPLVVGSVVIVATERNSVYGLSRATGKVLWHQNFGAAVTKGLPCGNINPLGITGTPVYDGATKRVFFVATTPNGSSIKHVLYGVNPATGQRTFARRVDAPNQDPLVENQRGALAAVKGRILIPYGGHAGDCGAYHGYLVSVASSGSSGSTPLYYKTGTQREAGMWQPSGISVDASGYAYAVTGNGAATSGAWDGGNAVMKFDPVTLRRVSYFAPSNWASGNQSDSDLGSSGAALVGTHVWIQGKSSTGYVLNQSNLGGIGHPLHAVGGACQTQFGGAAVHALTVIAPCTDGLRQLVFSTSGAVRLGWKAPSQVTGSPIIGGGAVWSLDPSKGVLYALSGSTGRTLRTITVGPVVRFATPALSGSLIFVPTKAGITAVSGA